MRYYLQALLYLFMINLCFAHNAPSVWDVIREQCYLDHALSQPQVQQQIKWIVAHPGYLQNLSRSEPYIYHIVSEIKKRKLPGELALLPMIESAFNPFAYSGVGAAGIWQIMPGTGGHFGLTQDWWFDARRSVQSSTKAALDYLSYLNKFFSGHWILAIASYDAGEGTVSRAIKSVKPGRYVDFWTLPLPNETKNYIPRLLALAEVIKNPDRYHIQLPYIPYTPYFEEVKLDSSIDLAHAAQLAGMSFNELIQLNPGYNRWTTAPNQPFKLLIPKNKVSFFNHNLSKVPRTKRVSFERHQVQVGDNLDSIARRYFTTPTLLKQLNQLSSDNLKAGQYIILPKRNHAPGYVVKALPPPSKDRAPSMQTYKVIHIVQKGETLQSIEKKYQLAPHKLNIWNTIPNDIPRAGQQLLVWKSVMTPGKYTIAKGDKIDVIAKRYRTTVAKLRILNPSLNVNHLLPGQQINVG